jgi:hypothetical protein
VNVKSCVKSQCSFSTATLALHCSVLVQWQLVEDIRHFAVAPVLCSSFQISQLAQLDCAASKYAGVRAKNVSHKRLYESVKTL